MLGCECMLNRGFCVVNVFLCTIVFSIHIFCVNMFIYIVIPFFSTTSVYVCLGRMGCLAFAERMKRNFYKLTDEFV